MSRCLGIYVDNNLIKYAKLRKVRNTYKVECFNVEICENLRESLIRIITETNSVNIPISINISGEIYNYFNVFSILEKKDIEKSLDIEFGKTCDKNYYDKDTFDSRYLLTENKHDSETLKAIYISVNKEDNDEIKEMLKEYKLFSMAPVATSITNLLGNNENKNIAIINLENETKITTVISNKIEKVNILNNGLEKAVSEINDVEMSLKKSYDVFKNITIYEHEVKSLANNENEYLDVIMPELKKIANEVKDILSHSEEKIDKVYITGMGATISNIEIFFQNILNGPKCEILKPFFIDSGYSKVPVKEYIEVNSAIAMALDGFGFVNRNLNFVSISRLDVDIENIKNTKDNIDIKNWRNFFKEPLDIEEKLLVRGISVFVIAIFTFSIFGGSVARKINNQKNEIRLKLLETQAQIDKIKSEIDITKKYINTYTKIIDGETNVNVSNTQVPDLLNKIMFDIPKDVQIISIKNVEENKIYIEAVSEKEEKLKEFISNIKLNQVLEDVKSSDLEKNNSISKITIEGVLK